MKTIFTLLISFLSLMVAGQTPGMLWLKSYGGNISASVLTIVTKTEDGGFIVSIRSNSTSGPIDSFCDVGYYRRIIFQKYNGDASLLEWSKCYKSDFTDTAFLTLFQTIDGGFVSAGEIDYGSQWIVNKENHLGNLVWSKIYGGDGSRLLEDMIATRDKGYIMIGDVFYTDTNFTVHNSGSLNADIGVLKIDSLGNKMWGKAIGGSEDDNGTKILEAPGGYYIVGNTSSNDSDCTGNHLNYDVYLARLDSNGNMIWHRDLGGSGNDKGNYACDDGRGGVIIAATTNSSDGDVTHQINVGGTNLWAIDVDSNNNIVWNNCYGGGGSEYAKSICKSIDGSIWLVGYSQRKGGEIDTLYGSKDAWFVHADSVGNFLNAKVLGSSLQDEGEMIYPLSTGNVIAGGYFGAGDGSFQNEFYGGEDAFFTVFLPEDMEVVPQTVFTIFPKIFPNPAVDEVSIERTQSDNFFVTVTDITGKIFYQVKTKYNVQIKIKDWPRGMYYVQITTDGNKTLQKLILE